MIGRERLHADARELESEWEALADSIGAPPFLRYGWFRAWREGFGGPWDPVVVRSEGKVVALAPLGRTRMGTVAIANDHSPLFGLLAQDRVAAAELARRILEPRSARVSLWALSMEDPGAQALLDEARRRRFSVGVSTTEAAPFVDLRSRWEEYEAGLRSKLLAELRRRRRRLNELGELALEVYAGEQATNDLLEEGLWVEDLGWKGTYGSSILSNEQTHRFYTAMACWAAERGSLRLCFLRLGGRPLAFDLSLEEGGVHYLVKTGFDPAYRRYAPGMLMRQSMLMRCFGQRGLDVYDFLGDHYGWKHEWTENTQGRMSFTLWAPTLAGRSLSFVTRARTRSSSAVRNATRAVAGERGVDTLKRWRGVVRRRGSR